MMSSPVKVYAIVAMDESSLIGAENAIPWHLPEDMKRFSNLTRGHTVLMGRKTYESLPDAYRPLPGRQNVVVSRSPDKLSLAEEVQITGNPVSFVESVRSGEMVLQSNILWVIGGQQIYELLLPLCDGIYLTRVDGVHQGDAYFPNFQSDFKLVEKEPGTGCVFEQYARSEAA